MDEYFSFPEKNKSDNSADDNNRTGNQETTPVNTPVELPETNTTSLPAYQLVFVDNDIPPQEKTPVMRKYADGIPDDVASYEEDQLNMMDMVKQLWDLQRSSAAEMPAGDSAGYGTAEGGIIKSPDTASNLDIRTVSRLPDRFVHNGLICGIPATENTEINIVGDLHGCFDNLEAVLWQTDFIRRVNAGEDVYLVLLGDFLDRGTRTLDGILPLVLMLVLEYPERVVMLRGNHEHFIKNSKGIIESAVQPCDTITFWKQHLSNRFFEGLMNFFNQMPVMALFKNGIIATHGGIPPQEITAGIDLISDFTRLDELRTRQFIYTLLWTDPGKADDIPIDLKNVFHAPFGRNQFRHFMEKMGARLLIRGHEMVRNGCEFTYPGSLITLFSAGGRDNPHALSYNNVTPRFLRITNNTNLEAVRIRWEEFTV